MKERVEKASLCGWSLGESALGTEGLGHSASLSVERSAKTARIRLVLQRFLQALAFLTGPCDTLILRLTLWEPSTEAQSQ